MLRGSTERRTVRPVWPAPSCRVIIHGARMPVLPFGLVPFRLARLRSLWRSFVRRFHRLRRVLGRGRRALHAAPVRVRVLVLGVSALTVLVALNLVYHVARKPTEMFFPLASALNKSSAETWAAYGPMFQSHATATITPELLAALAQVEGTGNPVAHTYWRWRLSWNPFEIYRPASSAVGMYQMTDAAFAEARHYCIHHHQVVAEGPWWDVNSCWFNSLYMRVVPSHAIELTAVWLDRAVADIVARHATTAATPQQKQDLAAIVHLCGAGTADAYARRGFRLRPRGLRCGDHDAERYLMQVNTLKRVFSRLAAGADGHVTGIDDLRTP